MDNNDLNGHINEEDNNDDSDGTEIQCPNKDEDATDIQEINKKESLKESSNCDEIATIIEPRGNKFDPLNPLAILCMVQTSSTLRKKELPKLYHLKNPITRIGTGKNDNIKVDNLELVKVEHAAIAYIDNNFYLYPQNGIVKANGQTVTNKGEILKHGTEIEVGNEKFVFLLTKK